MILAYLFMIVGGIGLSQAASNPHHVTLAWLRLGGIVSLCLAAVGSVIGLWTQTPVASPLWIAVTYLAIIAQLGLTQLAWRHTQRLCGGIVWLAASMACAFQLELTPVYILNILPASAILGGLLMTMLLGHAYLTAGGEMTQQPFARLVMICGIMLVVRLISSAVFGLWPMFHQAQPMFGSSLSHMWDQVMIVGRYLVGIVVPAVFIYMIYDCVKRRSNQSATGILYVAGMLVMMGEGIALALLRATGLSF